MQTLRLAQLFRHERPSAPKAAAVPAPVPPARQASNEALPPAAAAAGREAALAAVAHELRNAMAPLGNALAIMGRDPSPEVVARVLPMAERQLRQMGFLVNDLLDSARLVNGRMELQLGRVTLQSLVDDALRSCAYAAGQRGHGLATEMPQDGIWVEVDTARMQQVLSNLLCNAIKFTPAGGRISALVWREPGWACLSVSDNGIGIAAPELNRIFELFSQEESSRALSSGGLGIGLALARRLVELHGGSITAQSAGKDQGSTFTVRLPEAA